MKFYNLITILVLANIANVLAAPVSGSSAVLVEARGLTDDTNTLDARGGHPQYHETHHYGGSAPPPKKSSWLDKAKAVVKFSQDFRKAQRGDGHPTRGLPASQGFHPMQQPHDAYGGGAFHPPHHEYHDQYAPPHHEEGYHSHYGY